MSSIGETLRLLLFPGLCFQNKVKCCNSLQLLGRRTTSFTWTSGRASLISTTSPRRHSYKYRTNNVFLSVSSFYSPHYFDSFFFFSDFAISTRALYYGYALLSHCYFICSIVFIYSQLPNLIKRGCKCYLAEVCKQNGQTIKKMVAVGKGT